MTFKTRYLACLAILSTSLSSTLAQPPTLPTDSKLSAANKSIQAILAAEASHLAAHHFEALFRDSTSDDLQRLQRHESDFIALQAAWRLVDLTVPEKEPTRVVRPDRDKLARFLGYLEGRGRVQIPAWWSEAILDARANRRGNIYAGGHNSEERREANPPAKVPPEAAEISTANGKTLLKVGKTFVPLSADLQDKLRAGIREHVIALLTPTRCYIAAHDDVGYSYQLACVDRETNKTLWTAPVWASWTGGATGQHYQWVEITAQDNRVIVFGIASVGFHAEAFSATDGKNLWRFSNLYSR